MVAAVGGDVTFADVARRGQPLDGELVVDAHTHMGGSMTHYYVPQGESGPLVDYMDIYGIDAACTFAYAGVTSDFVYGNDQVAAAQAAHPERVIGYATLNANYPEEVVAELDRCERLGLKGIKLISGYQGHSEETERFFPVYEWAQQHRKIILSHQWGRPEFLAALAPRYPDVAFLIGHLNLDYAPVVRSQDNVYTTTTFVPWPAAIEQALAAFGDEKVLFGSDFPDLDVSLNLGPLLTAKVSDDSKRRVLGLNMQRLLCEHGVPGWD